MYVVENLRLPMIALNNSHEHKVIDQNEYAFSKCLHIFYLSRLCAAKLPTPFSEPAVY